MPRAEIEYQARDIQQKLFQLIHDARSLQIDVTVDYSLDIIANIGELIDAVSVAKAKAGEVVNNVEAKLVLTR